SFTTQLYQVAAAWSPFADRSLRLGLSAGGSDTSYGANSTLSGLTSFGGQSGEFLSSFRTRGAEWDGVFGAGVQWDIVPGLTAGAGFRTPGVRISSSVLVTYESGILTPPTASSSFLRDQAGAFEYRLPVQASLGIAWHSGAFQIEGDVRYHAATGT